MKPSEYLLRNCFFSLTNLSKPLCQIYHLIKWTFFSNEFYNVKYKDKRLSE